MAKFILITSKDPWLPPTGGTSAFASHLLKQFNEEIAVISMTQENLPKGKWITREFNNKNINFFNLGKHKLHKTFVPSRLSFLLKILCHRSKFTLLGIKRIFIDSPEVIFALNKTWNNCCYMFHGLNNPVEIGRYKYFQWLASIFEKKFIDRLSKFSPSCILAAADNNSILNFYDRTNFNNRVGSIISFPTRVDNRIFFPIEDTKILKSELGIKTKYVFTVTGRLSWIKGWDLLIDAFKLFNINHPDSCLIFVGDGEDRSKIECKISKCNLGSFIIITGFLPSVDVAKYINIADLCLVGSYREGWSVAMCEMLACGKGIVTTDVSGASDMVINSKNGYIVKSRNAVSFHKCMEKALGLENRKNESIELSKNYSLNKLKDDLQHYWF